MTIGFPHCSTSYELPSTRLEERPFEALAAVSAQVNLQLGAVAEATEEFSRSFGEQLRSIAHDLRELPERTRQALRVLGEHGWYVDMLLTPGELAAFAQLLESGDVEAAEQHLAHHYRQGRRRYWQSCVHRSRDGRMSYHGRSKLMDGGEYELSVPVFLIQADGVCQELLGTQLFGRRGGQPVTAHAIKGLGLDYGWFEAALLHPLSLPLPITEVPVAIYHRGRLCSDGKDIHERHRPENASPTDRGCFSPRGSC